MTEPSVGIVLVNYNGAKFQNECIRSIKKIKYTNYKIIVVDNASTDNSLQMLKEEFVNDVTLIKHSENTGITGGNNAGMKYCMDQGLDYVLLLNNDTEVDENFLSNMIKLAEEKHCCVIPKIYFYDEPEKVWFAGCEINWLRGVAPHYDYLIENHDFNSIRKLDCANTCCFLIPTDIMKKVGFMNDDYFIYYDDTDYCFRVIKGGFDIYYTPESEIWHKVSSSSGGATSPLSLYYSIRNRLYFMKKNCKNPFQYMLFRFYLLCTFIYKDIVVRDENVKRIRKVSFRHFKENKMGKQQWNDV